MFKKPKEIQVFDAGSKVLDEEKLYPTQVVLNCAVQAVLPDVTMSPENKDMPFS